MQKNTGKSIDEILNDKLIDFRATDRDFSEIPESKPKIISFYAEKGGVGKTTICTTLAYTLAASGKRVLIYDCDVQCSLTAWVFGNNLELHYKNSRNKISELRKRISRNMDSKMYAFNLFDQMQCNDDMKPAFAVEIKDNLFLVFGDRRIYTLDEQIVNTETITSDAFKTFGFGPMPNQKTGMPYHAIMATAKHYKIDYVLLDMNPYPGTLNRCLIMSSHYLIVPACLDYFCQEMMHNMKSNLEAWEKKTNVVKQFTKKGAYPWPDHSPKFLGYIANNFKNNKKNEITEDDLIMDDPLWASNNLTTPGDTSNLILLYLKGIIN